MCCVFINMKGRQTLLHDRAKLLAALTHCASHVPKSHMLLIAGDCNTPLTADAPHVSTSDPKFSQVAQSDKHDFQTMARDLGLVALHCKHKWSPTFVCGHHSSRIDFTPVEWNKHGVQVLTRLERTIGCTAPCHHPLVLSVPIWFASPRVTPPINSIDRHRLRQEYWIQIETWHAFESQVLAKVQHVTSMTENSHPNDPVSTCIKIEQAVRMLCQQHFPKVRIIRPTCPQVKSMATQM